MRLFQYFLYICKNAVFIMVKKKKIFNVIYYDFNKKTYTFRDILPYFRNRWKDKYHKKEKNEIKESGSFEKLKKWVESESQYQFWARCEYVFLIASWPFGSYRLRNEMKDFFSKNKNFDLNDTTACINFDYIIIRDMVKIDIHEQIMMNIDIITEILYNDFKLKKNE